MNDKTFIKSHARATKAADFGSNLFLRVHQAIWAAHTGIKSEGDLVELGTGRGFIMSAVLESIDNWNDLNRNYPDPEDGQHPDGNPWQDETVIFMGLADTVNFTISANMHGGVEVCNYPWDTWITLAADDNWWQYVSTEYADSCQTNSGNGYFNYLNDGITNGWDWYEVDGGRQDYMNYFRYCREFTLELSNDKTPNPNDLPMLWDANYTSLLNYMEQSLFGLRGIVTDSITGAPLKAKIEILGHDVDSSHVYSNLPIGNYHRHIYQGNYNNVRQGLTPSLLTSVDH